MSNEPKISAVIPSRQEGEWIEKTVRSLLAACPTIHEVIVIDDGSTDGSCDKLADVSPLVRVIRHETPQGIAASRNEGINAADFDSDAFLVLDGHMEVTPRSVELLVETALKHQGIACASVYGLGNRNTRSGARYLWMEDKYVGYRYGFVGDEEMRLARLQSFGLDEYKTKPKDDEPRPCCLCGEMMPDRAHALRCSGNMYRHPHVCTEDEAIVQRIEHITGAFYAIPRSIWQEIGGWYNTAGVWGHSEVSMSIACYFLGIPLFCDERAIVGHRYGNIAYSFDSTSQWRNAARAYWVMFSEETFNNYWRPIFEQQLMKGIIDDLCADADRQRIPFQQKKRHSDREFFTDMLKAPVTVDMRIPKVSVIIPACNEGEEVRRTVQGILDAQPIWTPKIIVVDDQSTDESCEYGRRKLPEPTDKHRGCTILRTPKRLGVAGSRNFGAANTPEAEALVFTDSHTRWEANGMRDLAQAALDRGSLVAAAFYNFKGDTQPPAEERKLNYGATLKVRKEMRGLGNGYNRARPKFQIARVQSIIGSSYAIPRPLFARMGGWIDVPGGLWGYGETEWALRSFFLGEPLYVHSDVVVGHRLRDNQEFPYNMPIEGVLTRAYFTHRAFFSDDVYEKLWKPILANFGPEPTGEDWRLAIDAWRAYMKAQRVKTEADFFREMLPGEYPEREVPSESNKTPIVEVSQKPVPIPPPMLSIVPPAGDGNGVLLARCCPGAGWVIFIQDPHGRWWELVAGLEPPSTIRTVAISDPVFCRDCGRPLAEAPVRPAKNGIPKHFENQIAKMEKDGWQ